MRRSVQATRSFPGRRVKSLEASAWRMSGRFHATPSVADRLDIMNCKQACARRGLHDERGSIMVEYAMLLSLVAIGCAAATFALGVPLVKLFMAQEVWLALAVP